jgi:sigma-B regulation protein RsbU (phosphoserine phosphatase)
VPDICRIGIQPQSTESINQSVLDSMLRQGKRGLVSHALAQEYDIAGHDAPSRFLASALKLDGHTRGYLCLGRRLGRAVFLSPDQKLISAVALLIAVEFENIRLQRSELDRQQLLRELQLARSIQQSLLPQDFSAVGFLEASGSSEPCFEIGGDFFDLVSVDEGLCALVIADVSGKGPPAALHASMVQGIVHAVFRTCPRLPLLMSTLNDCLLTHSAAGRFVTAFAATLSSNGRLSYSNAGHPPPLWIPREGNIVELGEGVPLLGIFPRIKFSEAAVQMAPGDLLVLYTDGVTEAHDPDGNLFGSARLFEWAREQCGRSPREVQDSLLRAVSEFCGGCRQNDDSSVLVVRYGCPGNS